MIKSEKLNFWLNEKILIIIVFAWLLTTYHFIYQDFFPFPNRYMGHDYSLFLPMFIDNYFWFAKNGLFSPPWFSPAFCGGQVNFADPQSMYYSLPQALIFADIELIKAVYLSVLIFASIGFYGMYILGRQVFKFTVVASLLCAAIFMYNDFFIYRMIVGHMTFQGFMLIPLISYCLLKESSSFIQRSIKIAMAGTLIAYWYVSGMAIIMVPCLISIIAIALIYFIYQKSNCLYFFINLMMAGLLSIALSASKLMGSIALIGVFPRTEYPLPGLADIGDIINVFFHSLFESGAAAEKLATPLWRNSALPLPPHEMAFGLTAIPLVIVVISIGFCISYHLRKAVPITLRSTLPTFFYLIALALILFIPIAILYYSEPWNIFLKTLPIISSTATPQRWMLIYIFVTIMLMGIAATSIPAKAGKLIFFLSLLFLPIIVTLAPKTDTLINVYSSKKLSDSFNQAKSNKMNHKIQFNAALEPFSLSGRNYFVVDGYDVLNCYNPTYGYFLEKLAFDKVVPGETLSEIRPGELNVRNPACILYPEENKCQLWDNFSTQQLDMATAFVNYKPFHFERSIKQRIADIISTISCVGLLLFLGLCFVIKAIKRAA